MINEGLRIKFIREKHGLTQLKVAEILGVSKQYFNRAENNLTDLSKDKIMIFCDYFKVSIDWLLTGKGEPFLTDLAEQDKENILVVKLKKGQLLKVEYED